MMLKKHAQEVLKGVADRLMPGQAIGVQPGWAFCAVTR